jgi:hypothetical protein
MHQCYQHVLKKMENGHIYLGHFLATF